MNSFRGDGFGALVPESLQFLHGYFQQFSSLRHCRQCVRVYRAMSEVFRLYSCGLWFAVAVNRFVALE